MLAGSIHEALARARAEQARLPATTVRERLERLLVLDQAGRDSFSRLDFATTNADEQRAAQDAAREIAAQDLADQTQLKSMIPPKGWFTRQLYGKKAVLAAWLVVQHAVNDPDLMRSVLTRLRPLAAHGAFEGSQYAIMYDRIALMLDHRPQRYGSQVVCRKGAWRADNLEAPAQVDSRRRAVGLKVSEAQYLKTFDEPCG